MHVDRDGLSPEEVNISREVDLGVPRAFADIGVKLPSSPSYFVEVKYGYHPETMVSHLARKYGADLPAVNKASKVVLVVDAQRHKNWKDIKRQIESSFRPGLKLEVWDETHLASLLEEKLGLKISSLSDSDPFDLKAGLDGAAGRFAFGEKWRSEFLQLQLLWHFGAWRLKQLADKHDMEAKSILPPKRYENVVILLADLSSYSSYVRDTRDQEVIRHALTSFCTKSRHEIQNTGGMLYQYIGDEVVGLYGIPDNLPGYLQHAMEAAKALIDVGRSVSSHWQNWLDRVQGTNGVHIGMAIGDLHVVSNRPFGRSHLGVVGDAINVAARLLQYADSGEIVISNSYYRALDRQARAEFTQLNPVEARNLGKLQAWKLNPRE
jgi:class 3 adenylate cyclase